MYESAGGYFFGETYNEALRGIFQGGRDLSRKCKFCCLVSQYMYLILKALFHW